MYRLGIMLILFGLIFSISDLIHAEKGYPQTLYADSILSSDSGGYNDYFENKEYELKVVASDNESYTLRVWDANALFEEPYGKCVFESTVSSSQSWRFTFPHRGFYSIEIENVSERTNEFILSYIRYKGIQQDFQLHSMALMIAGAIFIIIGAMIKEEDG